MSKFKRTSAKGAFWCLAMWLAGLCISAPAYSAVCFLPGDTGNCGMAFEDEDQGEETPDACDGKTTVTPQEFSEKYDSNCYTYTAGEKNGQTVYCDIKVSESDGYKLDSQKHCCPDGTAWDSKSNECCTGGKCPVVCDSDLYIVENDVCVCKNGAEADGSCCPDDTHGSNGICCPSGEEGKEDEDGTSLICCPGDQINKGGTCVNKVVEKTCSQISESYKASCSEGYTKEAAKDKSGELVKDTKGTQCYICKPNGKNPLTVRLRFTCKDAKNKKTTCLKEVYDGTYTLYYNNAFEPYAEKNTGVLDENNDIVFTIPDYTIYQGSKHGSTDVDDAILLNIKGRINTIDYSKIFGKWGNEVGTIALDVMTNDDKANLTTTDLVNISTKQEDFSGPLENVIERTLLMGDDYADPVYKVIAKISCDGPYEEITECNKLKDNMSHEWGETKYDDICPLKAFKENSGDTVDYFLGNTYDQEYANTPIDCADYRVLADKDEWPDLITEKIIINNENDLLTLVGDAQNNHIMSEDYAKTFNFSKLKSSEKYVMFTLKLPLQSKYNLKYFKGKTISIKITPKKGIVEFAKPDKPLWTGGLEYAFSNQRGRMSAKLSTTLPLDLKDEISSLGYVPKIHPVIRLKSVIRVWNKPQDYATTGGSKIYTIPAYQSFRNVCIGEADRRGCTDLGGDLFDEHWNSANINKVGQGVLCTTSSVGAYITASRNVLSPISTSLSGQGKINADIIMRKGDIIGYPDSMSPWCLSAEGNEFMCRETCGCSQTNMWPCLSCLVEKCGAGINTDLKNFVATHTYAAQNLEGDLQLEEGEQSVKNDRKVDNGPTEGSVFEDGAFYIYESGFLGSDDGINKTTPINPKTCEDFGGSSNLVSGLTCRQFYPKAGLSCYKCALKSCDTQNCRESLPHTSKTFCTNRQSETEGIRTTCARLAEDREIQDSLTIYDTISVSSKFVDYFLFPDNPASIETRQCAVCVYDTD